MAMVAIGSGGAFSGMVYYDDAGRMCSAKDYILNRLPMAQVEQFIQIFWATKGIECEATTADSAGNERL